MGKGGGGAEARFGAAAAEEEATVRRANKTNLPEADVAAAGGDELAVEENKNKNKNNSSKEIKQTFQKRMWPVPDVMSWPSKKSEKDTWKTSWLKALERSTIDSCFQLHTVSQKSGKEPTEASCVPSLLKRSVE